MLTRSLLATALLSHVIAASAACAGDASAIRIEPRSYYGAVVTVEQGVRVWRPLPPTRHMIINPTGAPVSINLADVRETVHHRGMLQHGNDAAPVLSNGGHAPIYYAGRAGRFHGHNRSFKRAVGVRGVRR